MVFDLRAGSGRRALSCLARGVALIVLGGLAACTTLPSLDGRSTSLALDAASAERTPLGRAIAPQAAAHPQRSGIRTLTDPREAFAVRAQLIDAAHRSIDAQYYIWHRDTSGLLLLDRLREAADRGVRVRLLLDDSANAGMDDVFAALHAHPHIEVRLFNPLALRAPRWLNYLLDFPRLNRRMHNKSLTIDSRVTLVGGRNIGDEYFGGNSDLLFSDLDVLAVGQVVPEVADDFDRYWNSASAFPADLLLTHDAQTTPTTLDALRAQALALQEAEPGRSLLKALQESRSVARLLAGRLYLDWAPTRMLSDDPAKVLAVAHADTAFTDGLKDVFGAPTRQLDLVSAYFVPTRHGSRFLQAMAARGVQIRILTNSLAATDVAAVHAGYARWRKPLLRAGIHLYEMRPEPGPVMRRGLLRPHRGGSSGTQIFGSASASLHAKTLAVDGKQVFIGSFNFDPRSARLNTELGFVIDSPLLAQWISASFDEEIPLQAWRLGLNDADALTWTVHTEAGLVVRSAEPEAGLLRTVWASFLSLFALDWML